MIVGISLSITLFKKSILLMTSLMTMSMRSLMNMSVTSLMTMSMTSLMIMSSISLMIISSIWLSMIDISLLSMNVTRNLIDYLTKNRGNLVRNIIEICILGH